MTKQVVASPTSHPSSRLKHPPDYLLQHLPHPHEMTLQPPTLFISAPLPPINRQSRHTPTMSVPKGFAEKPKKRPSSKAQVRREKASKRYDDMAAEGMPEYTVWMRLKAGGTLPEGEEEMPWLPVGCISVPRSSQISNALFEAEEDLLQGAERLYPNLKGEPRENILFGYQLRDFDDEEIRVAERPDQGFGGVLRKFFGGLQNPMNAK